jgi:putative sterol carrier protein
MKFLEGIMCAATNQNGVPLDFSALGSNLMSFFVPQTENESKTTETNKEIAGNQSSSQFTPYKLLKLLEPLLNESVVNEIQTVYEFHIKMDSQNPNRNYQQSQIEIFYLDLKNAPKGMIGQGPSPFSKADCIIKLNDEDLNELLLDKLKPFTAYISGRIEIEGDLQDVFKLKKLIKSVSTIAASKIQQLQQ